MSETIGCLAIGLIFCAACFYILFIRRDQFDEYAAPTRGVQGTVR